MFDSSATCEIKEASKSGKKFWCTQVHCCKYIGHEKILAKALALNGTDCNCNGGWPCVSVDHGGCQGSGRYDVNPIDVCWDEFSPSSVPCFNGRVLIPKKIF